MNYKHCQSNEFKEAKSSITGNTILVNMSNEKIFIPLNIDLNIINKIGATLPEFWNNHELTNSISWKKSPLMKSAFMSFENVRSLHEFMSNIDQLIDAIDAHKCPRGQAQRALYLLTIFWSHDLLAIPPSLIQKYKSNCDINEITAGSHWAWLKDVVSVSGVKSEKERLRTIGLALRVATTAIGIKEIGDITPDTCYKDIVDAMGTRGPGILKIIFTTQVNTYGTAIKTTMADWNLKTFRLRKKSDVNFMWAVNEDSTLELWRQFLVEWLKQRNTKGPSLMLGDYFLNYLIANKQVTRNPEEFCRKNYSPSFSFVEWNNLKRENKKSLFDANNLAADFINWILDSKLSNPDDYGRPVRSPEHWNSIVKLEKGSSPIQTHRESIPTRYLNEMIKILTEDNYAWPKKASKNDWITWFNNETGEWEKVWSPVRVTALLIKLYLPLRTFQVRVLDSGEADSNIYMDGKWIKNTGNLAPKNNKKVRNGFLRQYSDNLSGRTHTGFFINTNKTQDRTKSEDNQGYDIPWQHEEVIRLSSELLSWQKKYNPIDAPQKWINLHDATIVRSGRGEKFGQKGEACFLFRDPSGTYRNEPLTDSRIRPFWILLQDEMEKRVAARGETLPDGSPILFIDKRDVSKHNYPLRPVFDLHTLRVSLITALATEGGVPIQILSKCIAGHASILMTIYYIKLGVPYITETLATAQKKIAISEQRNFCQFIQSAKYKELESLVVSNDSTGLKAINETNPGSWVVGDKGICPVGGALCHIGGAKLTSNIQLTSYTPAPGGANNCVRCRFMITGPAFMGGLVAHFNAVGVKLMDASERYRAKESFIRKMEDELNLLNGDYVEFGRMTELNAAYDRHERDMKEVDEISLNWHSTYKLIERCKSIMSQSNKEDGKLNLVLSGGLNDLETAIELTTDFDVMNAVCQVANVYPGEDITIAKLKRSRILDSMLSKNDRRPIFATLSDDEALSVGNEFVTLLMTKLGKNNALSIIEGRQMLESTGIFEDIDKLLQLHIDKPIRLSSVIDNIKCISDKKDIK